MEYCVVLIRGLDAQHRFVRKVCDLIQQDWTPQGGVFCIMNGGCVLGYVQAMVKAETVTGQVCCSSCTMPMPIPVWDKVEP